MCHAWPPLGLRGYKYLDEKVAARDFEAQDRSKTLIVNLDRCRDCDVRHANYVHI